MPEQHEKIDYTDPAIIFAFISGIYADFAVFSSSDSSTSTHYIAGVFLLLLVFPFIKHLVPQLILGIAVALPFPTLTVGAFLAILSQNRIIEALIVQGAIIAGSAVAGAVTGGVGAGVGVAAEGAVATGGAVAEGAGAVAEGAGAVAEGAGSLGAQVAEDIGGAGARLADEASDGGRVARRAKDMMDAGEQEREERGERGANDENVPPGLFGENTQYPPQEQMEKYFSTRERLPSLGQYDNDNEENGEEEDEDVTIDGDGTINLKKAA